MSKKPQVEPKEGKLLDLDTYRQRRVEEGSWPPPEGETKEYWRRYKEQKGKVKYDHAPFVDLQPEKDDRAGALWGATLSRSEQDRLMDDMIKRDEEQIHGPEAS